METKLFTVRHYEPGDYPTLLGWWQAHGGDALPESMVPASTCVVLMEGDPVASGSIFPCNCNHVAFFHGLVTRPGLTLRQTLEVQHALQAGLDCIMRAGGHTLLLGTVPAGGMLRGAKMAGFHPAGDAVLPVQRLVQPLINHHHGS